MVKNIKPSQRGELEITSINKEYLKKDRLSVKLMGRGFAWLDTGTQETMNSASNFIKTIEERQGLKVACLEEIAYSQGFIDKEKLEELAGEYTNEYGDYLRRIIS
jgi:glucose-1-phosphate thymidylyltransferase